MQFGLIGKALSHSYSEEIHKSIGNYSYKLLEISEDELSVFFKKRDFCGINVTIPYKEAVIPYLDEVSDVAGKIGSVNTVINKNGRLFGYNTDFYGMLALIKHLGIEMADKKVLILGTGGTSKTAFAVSQSLGAREIIFVSRTKKANSVTFSEAYDFHNDAEIIINTTPSGMFPDYNGTPVEIKNFPHLEGVIDAVYNPLRTNLVLDAKEKKVAAEGGLYMLAAQAVYASSLFLDKAFEENLIDTAFKAVKVSNQNIVFIGMPSSGKTTTGKLVAEKLGKDFFDSDAEITRIIGMPIAEFFEKYGEAKFRETETEVISMLAKKSGCVIATGGGAVLNPKNVRELKRNGVLIFLNRPLELLTPTSDRPLSSGQDALKKLFYERYPVYKSAADIEILSDETPENVVEKVLKEIF